MKRAFTVKALWDAEAEIFYSESDIKGLHIEAATLDEFEAVMHEVAAELIVANHMSAAEIASIPLRELLPTIVWVKPIVPVAA